MVPPSDLIPAGDTQICPSCRDNFAQGLSEGMATPVRVADSRGTGGRTPNSELRAMARETLSGNWVPSVIVTFLFLLIQQASGAVPVLGVVVSWILLGPLTLGFWAFYLGQHRGEPVDVGGLFSGFSDFGRALGIYWVMGILVALAVLGAALPGGVLAAIAIGMSGPEMADGDPMLILGVFLAVLPAMVVGLYMYLRYALAYLIAKDEPDLGVFECVKRSTVMMQGKKKKLFMLWFSFVGWHILGLLAFFIGFLWSFTYASAATAAFYDDLGDA